MNVVHRPYREEPRFTRSRVRQGPETAPRFRSAVCGYYRPKGHLRESVESSASASDERSRVSIRAHADAKLTQAQLEELASNLADKRYELVAKLEILNRQITMKDDCSLADAEEAASLREEIARASGIADQHNWIIAGPNLFG